MNSSEIIRFETAISAAAYKSVVSGLRGKGSNFSSQRAFKRTVKASIAGKRAAESCSAIADLVRV
jgi:hypothetical protein